ncbi:MAG: hypothetical protein ACREOK_04005 [Gemmatimonadaceae bacterium]
MAELSPNVMREMKNRAGTFGKSVKVRISHDPEPPREDLFALKICDILKTPPVFPVNENVRLERTCERRKATQPLAGLPLKEDAITLCEHAVCALSHCRKAALHPMRTHRHFGDA